MEECIICAELIGTTDRLWSITECGHSDICSQCFLRIRSLQDNMKCPSCKTELEYIICSNEKEKLFGSYERWGDTIVGYDHIFDSKSRMFMPSEYSKTVIDKLWLCKCSTCGQTRRELRQLRGHMSAEHNLMLCLLCIENKHCFPSEQKIYTQSEYEKHLRNGDGDGSNGHPSCEFCRKRYYDSSVLFTHLNKDHYSCHLCDKMGIMYKYYNKYGDLEHHFRRDHFLCEQKSCLERKFTAFANEIDLANHNRAWHPDVQVYYIYILLITLFSPSLQYYLLLES